MSSPVARLAQVWRTRAEQLRRFAPAAATAFEDAAAELEAAVRDQADEVLTLAQAATESGYSKRRIREMVADGTIPNAGRKGAPRIRRGSLPRKAPPLEVKAEADRVRRRMRLAP